MLLSISVTPKDYIIEVEGLNKFGALYLQPGGNGRVVCSVKGEFIYAYMIHLSLKTNKSSKCLIVVRT